MVYASRPAHEASFLTERTMKVLGSRVLTSLKLRIKFAKNIPSVSWLCYGKGVLSHGKFQFPTLSVSDALVHFESIPMTIGEKKEGD